MGDRPQALLCVAADAAQLAGNRDRVADPERHAVCPEGDLAAFLAIMACPTEGGDEIVTGADTHAALMFWMAFVEPQMPRIARAAPAARKAWKGLDPVQVPAIP